MLGLRFVRGLSLVTASGGHSSLRCGDRSSSRSVARLDALYPALFLFSIALKTVFLIFTIYPLPSPTLLKYKLHKGRDHSVWHRVDTEMFVEWMGFKNSTIFWPRKLTSRTHSWKNNQKCSQRFIWVVLIPLFIIMKICKQPKPIKTELWLNNLIYLHNGILSRY